MTDFLITFYIWPLIITSLSAVLLIFNDDTEAGGRWLLAALTPALNIVTATLAVVAILAGITTGLAKLVKRP